ncbi:MAG: AprI/Inh family metalloprotease inhibitor [Candidatus Kaistia colombiensis]|nr:MAG: AprI/Inh family metalloprotease inhibitor [Kaistia sp.]
MNRLIVAISLLLAGSVSALAETADVSTLKGSYSIWEDFEGGKVCPIQLDDGTTIGGFALEGDDQCMQTFKFDGDPAAWFVDDEGWLVLIDATRKILVRLAPSTDGAFYANRTADGLESLNLTPER